jgi:NAD(P)-dependent dehydrogenase (short-subunit alcohol dehydrogenase family)
MTKGGPLALTRTAAAPRTGTGAGVRCNAICPGLVQTPLAAAVLPETAQRMQQQILLPLPGRKRPPRGSLIS